MNPTEINRKIIISEPISDRLADRVIEHILAVNDYDVTMASVLANYEVRPIEMIINSGGGSASAGFAIIGAMEMSETPIVTYGLGIVASMALGIYVAGDVRIAHRYTRFMFHSVAYGTEGHIQDHVDGLVEVKKIQKMYNSLFKDRTNFPTDLIEEIIEKKKDYFFSGKQAVRYGVADDVMKKPEKKIDMVSEEEYQAILKELEAEVAKSK